ncbi:tetratricopeptide repeat protein [Sporomusa acidovorans]|uniref:TPR repeat-containing protein YrrB n=1 Tax=Sporomusa acidovorans (strain ATCC 49682 / DSM 3132 / Mol) TaxID=1123286 RepID=A0ABZ3J5K1_SPOA4|nr:tetratricopeptide repeat protein [Sporomusa acidovorans]OZC24281.1 TPR repeat-containing protein YrrB [Sporomusa acidovorans DSM 3132]SDF03164.1 Glycosyltransferase family 9 (heptosyltransferase) [Sporomusa acidovorans]
MTPKMYLDMGINLLMEGDAEQAITAFCAALQLDRSYAPAYNNLGLALKSMNRLQEAEACFCRAIELNPNDAYSYNNLGLVLMEYCDWQKAEDCFRRAVALEPGQPAIFSNLGTVLEEECKLVEAEAAYRQAIQLNPDYPEAHYNLGTFLKATQNFEEAEERLGRALLLRPDYFEANYSLATLYLLQGKFEKGWGKYDESRRKSVSYRRLAIPHWHGEDVSGCSILLCWEYGFGDTIQFARYAPTVAKLAAKTTLWVQKPLKRLLAAAYPDLPVYAGDCPPRGQYDYACSLISLPVVFNTCTKTVPRPVPCGAVSGSAVWREALTKIDKAKEYRVGVVWAGHPKHNNDANRSIPFHVFRSLFHVAGVCWVSLQVGERAADLAETAVNIVDLSGKITDFMDTAELLDNLDLVITVDTAVAHLAGSMGKKTWVLLPFNPDWRWLLEREDTPWYPTVRLFRQHKLGDWQEVVERVKIALQNEVRK